MDRSDAQAVADAFARDLILMVDKWAERVGELEQQGVDCRPLTKHLGNGLIECGQNLRKLAKAR